MVCRLSDLRHKEVVDLQNGEKLGFIDDFELETETASVLSLVLFGRERLWGLLRREPDLVIPFDRVRLIGKDTILVALSRNLHPDSSNSTKSNGISFQFSSDDRKKILETN